MGDIDNKDRFSDLIDQYSELFEYPVLLKSELTQMFPSKTELLQTIQNKVERKPFKYSPEIADISGRFIRKESILITRDFKIKIPQAKNFSYIIPVKLPNGNPGFVISALYDWFVYDSTQNQGFYIDKSNEANFDFKKSTFTIGEYEFTIFSTLKKESKTVIHDITQILQDMHAETYKPVPFLALYQTLGAAKAFPPVNAFTLPFYRSIFTDLNFLMTYQHCVYSKEDMKPLLQAWLNIVGSNFPALYKFIAWTEFKAYKSPSLAMRGNNFFVAITTYLIGQDPAFESFLNSLSLDSPTLIQDFMTGVENMNLSPRSRFLLNTIYIEGKRVFPETECKRFAVSGVLFLRLMSPTLLIKDPAGNAKIKPLVTIYNLQEKEQTYIEQITKLRELIDKLAAFPQDYLVEPSGKCSAKDIETLIPLIPPTSTEFVRAANFINYHDLYDQFLCLPQVDM